MSQTPRVSEMSVKNSATLKPAEPQAAPSEQRSRFEQKLGENGEKDEKRRGEKDRGSARGQPTVMGLLSEQRAIAAKTLGDQKTAGKETGTASAANKIESLAARIAEHIEILSSGNQNEVLIKLKDSILPQTEVRLSKTPDGGVSVVFNTSAAESLHLLNQHKGQLERLLKEKSQRTVEVSVVGKAFSQNDRKK